MKVTQNSPESLQIRVDEGKKRKVKVKYLLLSDIHFDNPKCDRDLLKSHLDQALKDNIPVFVNGDFFCVMQGKGDPRRGKEDIRPEHNKANYLDCVVNEAIEWWGPYAEILTLVGYGNHETTIIKHQETDVLDRFVFGMNVVHKPKNPVYKGGYGGWIVTKFDNMSHKIKYFHGSGGGGPVTGGAISHNRMQTFISGADVIWQGHIHESEEREYVSEYLDHKFRSKQKVSLAVTTPTYKEEYQKGLYGFHVERRAPPKPIGGRWLEIYFARTDDGYDVKQRTYRTI